MLYIRPDFQQETGYQLIVIRPFQRKDVLDISGGLVIMNSYCRDYGDMLWTLITPYSELNGVSVQQAYSISDAPEYDINWAETSDKIDHFILKILTLEC